uniref:Uncharacterized protein n=1 Tax=Rhizophora mucronata TaxID=61149 RepID=A0A2P2N5M8_RHIMU
MQTELVGLNQAKTKTLFKSSLDN